MQEKYRHDLWGAATGAVALVVVGFWGGWVTSSTARAQAEAAVWIALLPVCADAILTDPAEVAEHKTKRESDYDDVVRNHLKTIANPTDTNFAFRHDCGQTLAARLTNVVP
jgi:alpha/beta superfamily hydrolase